MVTRLIKTDLGKMWGFYPDLATAKKYEGVDEEIIPCTAQQMVFLSAHPEARWDGQKFTSPTLELSSEGTSE